MSEQPSEIEYKGFRIRVMNWNGRYSAWTGRPGREEIGTAFYDTTNAAIAAAKTAIDSDEGQ